jgi:catechol 2,3-dioxygenase-like lactoylglutathione lyase family enzyme
MFAYVCLGTNDLERATRFYDAALAALGLMRCVTRDFESEVSWAGWGVPAAGDDCEMALWVCKPFNDSAATAGNGTMVALRARSLIDVDHFHAAALAHGGTSEGDPGFRVQYEPDFYAAYVRDPDGNKLAAVYRGFQESQ